MGSGPRSRNCGAGCGIREGAEWSSPPGAADSRRDRRSVRAGLGMLEENAELFGDLRAQAVLNLTGILIQQIFVDLEHLVKQPLGKPMPPDRISGLSLTFRGE